MKSALAIECCKVHPTDLDAFQHAFLTKSEMAELKNWLAEWPAVRESVDDLVLSLKRR